MNKPRQRVDVLGVGFDAITISESNHLLHTFLQDRQRKTSYCMVKPYVEFLATAAKDEKIRTILNNADLCVADGVSIQWAASYLHADKTMKPSPFKLIKSLLFTIQNNTWCNKILPEKFAGIDHTKQLLDYASQQGWRVGILGGPKDTEHTKTSLQQIWPDLRLDGVWSGYSPTTHNAEFTSWQQDPEFSKIYQDIKSSNLDILLVAMGFPRQEEFMHYFKSHKLARIMIGEGGSLDYKELGGSVGRAPRWMRNVGLEWLWRLLRQPSRIIRQIAIPKFIWAVYRQAKRQYFNP